MEGPLPSHEGHPEYRAAGVLPISLVGETVMALIGAETVYKTSGSKVESRLQICLIATQEP